MAILRKIKDILFDEEEIVEDKPIVREEREIQKPHFEEPKQNYYDDYPKIEVPKQEIRKSEPVIPEKTVTRKPESFPFPDFDEAEFDETLNRTRELKRNQNSMEYERKKKIEKRVDYGRYQKTETREVVEKKKFKPSPIISPVYGVLNEDYKAEDVKNLHEVQNELNIDNVRKKAFGPYEEEKKDLPKKTVIEETETVTIENLEDKQEKVKTIDELLEDTSDEQINIDDDFEIEEKDEDKKNIPDFDNTDTLENDLFDLIDSMYERKEDD